jgi:formate hydrogenlyase transcriptional activator
LYYRLNIFPIYLPLLCERKADIPALVEYFVQQFAASMDKTIETIPEETMRAVVRHCWPGNIRELQNYIARGVILSNDGVFEPAPLEKRARREFERLRQTPGRKLSQARAATDHFTKILVAAPFIFLYLNRTLNFENIKSRIFAVIDWNYAAYCKVRDQEVRFP